MMTTREQLKAESSFVKVGLKSDTMEGLLRIARMYYLNASDVANYWDAYTMKNDVNTISDKEDFSTFERYLESSMREQRLKTPAKQFRSEPSRPSTQSRGGVRAYNKDTLHSIDADDFLNFDESPAPRDKRTGFDFRTPDIKKARGTAFADSPSLSMNQSPASQISYAKRTNAGQVEAVLNEHIPKDVKAPKRGESDVNTGVYKNAQLTSYRYMFEKLQDKADALDERIEILATQLCKRAKIEETVHVKTARQDNVRVVGRVCCDGEGRFNDKSVLLEGTREESAGERVLLDLSELEAFTLFPGQIIAAEGINSEGHRLVVKNIWQNARRNYAMTPAPALADLADKGGLRVMAAAGPYSFEDTLDYTPLDDLLDRVVRESPDVLILMGPFVDADNRQIKNPRGLHLTYEEVFEECISDRLRSLLDQTHSLQIVLSPSLNDVHHDPVLPQPPLDLSFTNKRLHNFPNPCTLTINEVNIGITSTDVLRQMEEISRVPAGQSDRMARLVNHLIEQRSYYPLYPPHVDVNMEFQRLDQLEMPVTPDILLLPSQLKYFVKEVNEVIAVNPGRLTRAQSGGTYATFSIHPLTRNSLPATGDKPMRHIVSQRTRTEVVRI